MKHFEKYKHFDPELEGSLIGVLLVEPKSISRVVASLKPEHFYTDDHEEIFRAITDLFNAALPIDILTVSQYLTVRGKTLMADGTNVRIYISRLTVNVVNSSHIEYWGFIIQEQWRRRELLKIKYESIEDDTNPAHNINQITDRLNEISGGVVSKEWASMDELMFNLIQHQTSVAAGDIKYITTGIEKINQRNMGYSPGDLIIIGARPSVGKSAFLGLSALEMARKGFKVGIVSLEMSNMQIAARLAAIETDIPFRDIYGDIARDEDLHKRFYDIVSKSTINLPICISDNTNVNINDIRAKAMNMKHKHGLDVLFIDYLQLIDGKQSNKNYNREQEVSQMSRGLKILAKEIEIPVIALAQLNREVEKRPYKHRLPVLSDLRESGSLEQDADIVMFLHSDYKSGIEINPEGSDSEGKVVGRSTENEADLLVRKWRNGELMHVELDFDAAKMKFSERQTKYIEPTTGQWRRVESSNSDNPF